MHPPAATCRALSYKHPYLRLGWLGRPCEREGDINSGSFAIVQLMHWRDCGSPDDPLTIREFWDVETVMDEVGQVWNRRAYRGPIFNTEGGTTPDWDMLVRKPILLFTVDEDFGLETRDVFTGDVQRIITEWAIRGGEAMAKRFVKEAKAVDSESRRRREDLVDGMTDYLWSEARQSDESPIMSKEEAEADLTTNYKLWREGKLDDQLNNMTVNKLPDEVRKLAGE